MNIYIINYYFRNKIGMDTHIYSQLKTKAN